MTLMSADYHFSDRKTPLSAAEFNRRFTSIDKRIHALESYKNAEEDAVQKVLDLSLTRIDLALTPLIDSARNDLEALRADLQTAIDNGLLQSEQQAADWQTMLDAAGAVLAESDIGSLVAAVDHAHHDTYVRLADRFSQNYILNGAFDIWQRGISQTSRGYGSDDRWVNYRNASSPGFTHSRGVLSPGELPIDCPYYASFEVSDSGSGSNEYHYKCQRIEGAETLAGQEVTLSFYAKVDTDKSIALDIARSYGAGGDSKETALFVHTFDLTTEWKRYSVTFTVPSVAGKNIVKDGDYLEVLFWLNSGPAYDARNNSLGYQSGTFDFAGVQLERGTIATPFTRAGGSIGGELALCKRYFERIKADNEDGYIAAGGMHSNAYAFYVLPFVEKRDIPSFTVSAASHFTVFVLAYGSTTVTTSVGFSNATRQSVAPSVSIAGPPAGNASILKFNNTSGFLDIDAEL